jgi:cell shape-determining protein MreC
MNENQPLPVVAHLIDDNGQRITQVVINQGSNSGVKLGDIFLIYGIGKEIIDPVTQNSLGMLELVRGKAEVTNVQPTMATLTSLEKGKGPATTRHISRQGGMSIFLTGNETIREEQEPYIKELDNVKVGDFARKIGSR